MRRSHLTRTFVLLSIWLALFAVTALTGSTEEEQF